MEIHRFLRLLRLFAAIHRLATKRLKTRRRIASVFRTPRLSPLASHLRQAYGGQARFFINRPSEIVIRNFPLATGLWPLARRASTRARPPQTAQRNIFIHFVPVDSDPGADQTPIRPLGRCRPKQTRKPLQRCRHPTRIRQREDQLVILESDADDVRRRSTDQSAHPRKQ